MYWPDVGNVLKSLEGSSPTWVYIAVVGTILYYEGLRRLKAAQVSALELATPFFAALLGFCVLGERVTAMQILGMVLLFAGVCLLSGKEDTRS